MTETPQNPEPAPRQPRLPHQVSDRGRFAGEPAMVVVQQRHPVARFFSWLGWVGLAICLVIIFGLLSASQDYFDTTEGIQEKYHSLSKTATDKIAVVQVSGVIMEGDGFVKRQIDRIRQDENVRGIIVRINSPGGTITGSDYMYHHLTKLREEKKLPLIVSMGSMATSGGYYAAMAVGEQEKSIYAEPTTTTGSIGVIIPHYDITGLMERYDIKDDSIATHPRKQMLSMTKSLTEEQRQLLEGYISDAFERFKTVVKSGRPKFQEDEAALDELATGEIFTATQALDSGLIDEIGFIEEAIDRVVEIEKLDKAKVRVVTYSRPVSLTDLVGAPSAHAGHDPISQMLQLTAPRAYYLCTTLPPLLHTYMLRP